MTPRYYAWFMAAIFFAAFLAANSLVGVLTRGVRLDLTEDRLYTLSPGTRRVLADLAEPVDVTFFYSATAAAKYPSISAYAGRVREMLQSYAGRSNGMLRVHEVEPVRFTESEDQASAAGIAPASPEQGGEPIYLGLSGANAVDERASIPALAPSREGFLEYDLTRLISQLEAPRSLNVAVISSLPLDPIAARDPQGGQPLFFRELARAANVSVLPGDFNGIPAQTSTLLVLQPWALSDVQLYAVDQFLLRNGRALIAVDPAAVGWDEGEASPFGPAPVVAPSANLKRLFDRWGLSLSEDVVVDGQNALNVEAPDAFGRRAVTPQPLYFRAPAAQMSRDDLITAGLTRQINFAAPGALAWTPTDGIVVTPLISSSPATMRVPAAFAFARPSPQEVIRGFSPSGKAETLAVRISGVLTSAFGATAPAPHIAKSQRPAQIVVVSDVDFLNNGFYVGEGRAPFADNGAFALNAIDLLSGSDALVSLRSRTPSQRPLTVIEDMRAGAAARLAETQARLRAELTESETKLGELQNRASTGAFVGDLGAERSAREREEIERFRNAAVKARADLRATERDYRRDIDRLQGWVMAINIWLAPLLVAGFGMYMAWRRTRRAGVAL